MFRYREKGIKNNLWLLLALAGPLAHFSGGGYWPAAITAIAVLPAAAVTQWDPKKLGGIIAGLIWIWTGVFLAGILPAAGSCWPGKWAELVVPGVLLALAGLERTRENGARLGNTLTWLAGLLLGGVLLASLSRLELSWMKPNWTAFSPELAAVMLLPALVKGESSGKTVGMVAGLGILFGGAVQGVLSPKAAANLSAPMYELGRSLGSPGFEILVSLGTTLGWYGLCSLVLWTMRELGASMGMKERMSKWVSLSFVFGLMLLKIPGFGWWLPGGCLLFWVVIPALKNKKEKR